MQPMGCKHRHPQALRVQRHVFNAQVAVRGTGLRQAVTGKACKELDILALAQLVQSGFDLAPAQGFLVPEGACKGLKRIDPPCFRFTGNRYQDEGFLA
jgi:hypothetical protein